jgi:hypothetical protein
MVPSIGLGELLCLVPILLVTFFVPAATLVLVFLNYRRLERIEKILARCTPPAE